MNAGRELDALIADRVMGMPHDAIYYQAQGREWITEQLPLYSTDIAEAMNVVGRMRSDGWYFALNDRNGEDNKPFWAEFATEDYERGGQAWEASASLAICLAALKARERP